MPRQIYILFNLLALFVIVYIAVDTFYSVVGLQLQKAVGEQAVMPEVVETPAASAPTAPEVAMILERNIFGATEKAEAPPVVEEVVEPIETLEETTLQLTLLGTIAGNLENARAIILDQRQRDQDIYRTGDTVQGAEIRQILRGKVVLRHQGRDEILSMVESSEASVAAPAAAPSSRSRRISRAVRRARGAPATGGDIGPPDPGDQDIPEEVIPIAQEELQSSMNNLNDLLTQVRIRPYFRQGQPEGLIVSQIQGGSIFAKLGLMNGDIIANVNGRQLSSPEEAFQFYNSLKSGSPVSIEITRRGQKQILRYEIE